MLGAAGFSQQQQQQQPRQHQQPTFKSATALVGVDIIARDKDGRFVSGLTADDFEVLEDGKPQPIQHFYLVTEPSAVTIEPRPDAILPRSPVLTSSSSASAPARSRVLPAGA